MQLSVVIPCLNEIETIGAVVRTARETLSREGISGEVVVADNGSTDGSQDLAMREGARIVPIAARGYGSALRGGIESALGDCVIFADADNSYDFAELGKFWSALKAGAEMAVGTRFPSGGGIIDPGAMPWLHRWVGTPVISLIGRVLFGSRLSDFNCGMRAMTRATFARLNLQTSGMEFASEMIIKATLFGLRIEEVPIHFHKDGRSGPPHLRTFRDGWRHLRFMLICSPRWLFINPGLLLAFSGLAILALLVRGPIHVGHVGFDTNTLLVSAMALLLGHQLVSLGIVAKLYAVQIGMHPASRNADFLRSVFRLESWAFSGLLMSLAGAALLFLSVLLWQKTGFGSLSYPDSLRLVIPAVTMIMLGMQVIFNSFLISIVSRGPG